MTGASLGPSIAVLPFANLGADPDNEYFADGMTEEIINALVNVPGLQAFKAKVKLVDTRYQTQIKVLMLEWVKEPVELRAALRPERRMRWWGQRAAPGQMMLMPRSPKCGAAARRRWSLE